LFFNLLISLKLKESRGIKRPYGKPDDEDTIVPKAKVERYPTDKQKARKKNIFFQRLLSGNH